MESGEQFEIFNYIREERQHDQMVLKNFITSTSVNQTKHLPIFGKYSFVKGIILDCLVLMNINFI